MSPNLFAGSISLRKFKVEDFGSCILSLIQKDRKYFRNNGYEYATLRMIVAMKDVEGYRFIAGNYGKQKVLSLNFPLNPGEYYVIVMGEWNRKILDVTLNYQGNIEVGIGRLPVSSCPDIL